MNKLTKVQAIVWMRGYGAGFNGEKKEPGNISEDLVLIYVEAYKEGKKEKARIYRQVI